MRYAGRFETQSGAVETLQGISSATLSLVKNNNWEQVSDRMWDNIARQVGFYCCEWQPADTSVSLLLRILFSDAQHYSMAYGAAIATGLGKTYTAIRYVRDNERCYYMNGHADHNRRSFLVTLLYAAGIPAQGTMPQMIEAFTTHMTTHDESLLIVDNAENLKDRVLHLLVILANSLCGKAGIVIMGSDGLRERIAEGIAQKKTGFDVLFQAIGKRFITLGTLALNDVGEVCKANGVVDEDEIERIKTGCGGNLHKAAELIHEIADVRKAA